MSSCEIVGLWLTGEIAVNVGKNRVEQQRPAFSSPVESSPRIALPHSHPYRQEHPTRRPYRAAADRLRQSAPPASPSGTPAARVRRTVRCFPSTERTRAAPQRDRRVAGVHVAQLMIVRRDQRGDQRHEAFRAERAPGPIHTRCTTASGSNPSTCEAWNALLTIPVSIAAETPCPDTSAISNGGLDRSLRRRSRRDRRPGPRHGV